MNVKSLLWLTTALSCLAPTGMAAQSDKKTDDDQLLELLTEPADPLNWHAPLTISEAHLQPTAEQAIFKVVGGHFQVESLRNDFYVARSAEGSYGIVFDRRFPLESLTNLMLNLLTNNSLQMDITLHQYGNRTPHVSLPMQQVFDRLAQQMELYASVTSITPDVLKGVLVMHQPRQHFIHMFIITVPFKELFTQGGHLQADLYGNIPQENVRKLF